MFKASNASQNIFGATLLLLSLLPLRKDEICDDKVIPINLINIDDDGIIYHIGNVFNNVVYDL